MRNFDERALMGRYDPEKEKANAKKHKKKGWSIYRVFLYIIAIVTFTIAFPGLAAVIGVYAIGIPAAIIFIFVAEYVFGYPWR